MEEYKYKRTINMKSKVVPIIVFIILIVVGIAVMALFSKYKTKFDKYYYVQGVVTNCDTEITTNGIRIVQEIEYTVEDKECVWEYVTETPKFFEGEKINLKVEKEYPQTVSFDLRSGVEKKIEKHIPNIVGVVFILAGIAGLISVIIKGKKQITIHSNI